jgi:regulator of RNase E activity RraA
MSRPALLAEHGTSVVSDALDLRGVHGAWWGPRAVWDGPAVAGPAFTVQFEPVGPGERAPAADFVDDVPPGSVVVLANAGRRCTVWGDILAHVALRRGIAGTVIDGYCRDLDRIRAVGYPVWALGVFMRSGKNRVRMRAVEVPVQVGEGDEALLVRPGDVVCADGSGVVVVPGPLVGEVVSEVARIAAMEALVLADVAAGARLRDARREHGYHQVARRPDPAAGGAG